MSFCEFAPIAQCVYHQVGDCFHGLRRSHTWGESWLQTLTPSMNSPGHSRHHSSSSRCTLLTTRFITRKASRRGRTDRTFSWQCGCKSTHSPFSHSISLLSLITPQKITIHLDCCVYVALGLTLHGDLLMLHVRSTVRRHGH